MAEGLDFEAELRAALASVPFVPLTIVLSSGDHYYVGEPRRVFIGLDTLTLIDPTRTLVVRFFNIVYFEVHAQSA